MEVVCRLLFGQYRSLFNRNSGRGTSETTLAVYTQRHDEIGAWRVMRVQPVGRSGPMRDGERKRERSFIDYI
jgi:hypothetical protein